jgi:DNA-binding GntR family transcriptional regulator
LQTKQQIVFDYLRREIESDRLSPGAHLVTREIAKKLNVSEIPVREAIRALEGCGLVQIFPYARAVVSPISLQDFNDIAQLRLALEPLGSALASQHLTVTDLKKLESHIRLMDVAIESSDLERYRQHDRDFHLILFEACPNKRLADLLISLRNASARNERVRPRVPSHAPASQKEHHAIMEALRAFDFEAVRLAVETHRRGIVERLGPMVAEVAAHETDGQPGDKNVAV